MSFLLGLPVFFKVIFSLALILFVSRYLKSFFLSISIGVIVLAFWSGQTVNRFFLVSYRSVVYGDTLFLLIVTYLIISLSYQMYFAGVMKDLVETVRARLSKRISIAINRKFSSIGENSSRF